MPSWQWAVALTAPAVRPVALTRDMQIRNSERKHVGFITPHSSYTGFASSRSIPFGPCSEQDLFVPLGDALQRPMDAAPALLLAHVVWPRQLLGACVVTCVQLRMLPSSLCYPTSGYRWKPGARSPTSRPDVVHFHTQG